MSKCKQIIGVVLAGFLIFSGCTAAPSPDTEPTTPDRLSEHDLVCLEYSTFSGAYPEDGTGRQVQDVAAMLVRNDSDKFLDYAMIQCDIGNGSGNFKVTGLPAGASVWVLEQDGKTVGAEETFKVSDCKDYAFRTDAILDTDLLDVQSNGDTVTVTNISNKTLENICIYYKTVFSDGNFFGGITYMLAFDSLGPDQSAQKQTSHFGEDSQIVRYSFQTA